MRNFYINSAVGLKNDDITYILCQFNTEVVPLLKKRKNYYDGKQQIIYKRATDVGKPCNKIVTNYCQNISDTYTGYAMGVPVKYQSDSEGFDKIEDILKYNDVNQVDTEFFKNGLIYGRAAEIYYMDIDAKVRFRTINPTQIVPVYDTTLENRLLYAIRFWEDKVVDKKMEPIYTVEVYDNLYRTTYKASAGFTSIQQVAKIRHFFNQVPVTFFTLNEDEVGVSDTIFSLQDAYNTLVSDSIDDWESFCDAYLMLKGVTADKEDLVAMKENRVLMLDVDADASYLTKQTTATEINALLERTEKKIREISSCPDMSDASFGTSSGIAIKFRLLQMENKTSNFLNFFKKALQRRIELLADIVKLVNGEEQVWRDVEIIFTRNLPTDMAEVISTVQGLQGIVSSETLLGQIPFVKDPAEELMRLQEEKKNNMSLYDFGDLFNREEETETVEVEEEEQ